LWAVADPKATPVKLSRAVRDELRRRTRCGKVPHRDVVRARIAVLAEEGVANAAIARRVGCDVKTVRLWRDRVAAFPAVDSLIDEPRSGRPPRVPIEVHQDLLKLACQRPADSKVPFEQVWTLSLLAETVAHQTGVPISRSEVARILEGADIKPHRVRMWLHSPDPEFRPKVAAICALYLRPPPGATVLCIDEKPGMQALEHRFPMHPSARGRVGRKEFEYIRHGTRTLIASYNVGTGEVLGRCGPTRTADDLVAFLEQVAAHHPTGLVYVIWDNLNIHSGPRWAAFNARHDERFHFVYTPKHASWTNQVEIWFSVLTRRVLRHASFVSADELAERVRAFIAHWNQTDRRPFRWTFRGRWRTVPVALAA
jgi:transposase